MRYGVAAQEANITLRKYFLHQVYAALQLIHDGWQFFVMVVVQAAVEA